MIVSVKCKTCHEARSAFTRFAAFVARGMWAWGQEPASESDHNEVMRLLAEAKRAVEAATVDAVTVSRTHSEGASP